MSVKVLPLTGSGDATANVAIETIAGEDFQRLKIALGNTGVDSGDISSTNPMPVGGAVNVSALIAGLPTGANNIGAVVATANITAPVYVRLSNTTSAIDTLPVSLTSVPTHGVAGDVAHDSADSGNPIKVGGRSVAHGANPTATSAADRTDWLFNRHGIPWVIGGHPNITSIRTNFTAANTDGALVTANSSQKIVVTRCSVTVDKACSVDVAARVGFGTASTPTGTGVILSHPGIAAGSGVVEGNGSGILGVGGLDEDLRYTGEVPTGGSVDVVASYYIIES